MGGTGRGARGAVCLETAFTQSTELFSDSGPWGGPWRLRKFALGSSESRSGNISLMDLLATIMNMGRKEK